MKTKLKRILSIALTVSLVWGIIGGIVPVKAYAAPNTITVVMEVALGETATESINVPNNVIIVRDDAPDWVSITGPDGNYNAIIRIAPTTQNAEPGSYIRAFFHAYNGVENRPEDDIDITINITVTCNHSYSDGWYANGTVHSRTCDICLAEESHAPNYNANGVCTVCGLRDPNYVAPAPSPEPEPENKVESPSTPPSGNINQEDTTPPEPEDPFAEKTKEVNDELDSILKLLSPLTGGTEVSLKYPQGITFDMGSCLSLKKETYEKIDKVLSSGFSVIIKYIYKGRTCTLTLPANCGAKLASYCGVDGYIGFENLKGKLIAGQYISASQSDILALLNVSNTANTNANIYADALAAYKAELAKETGAATASSSAANTAASISVVKSADQGVITLGDLIAMLSQLDISSGTADLDFGTKTNASGDVMDYLCKNARTTIMCHFTHNGSEWTLIIPKIDTDSEEYKACMTSLAHEPAGTAGFIRLSQLFASVGVRLSEGTKQP